MKRILLILAAILGIGWFWFSRQAKHESKKPDASNFQKYTAQDSAIQKQLPDTMTHENHSEVMDMILGKPKHTIKTIGILVYDGVNDLDFMGPRYILGQSGAKTKLIAIKPGNFKTVMGVEVVPNTVIDSVSQLDILIIPGGFKGTIEASYDTRLHDWIRRIDQNSIYTMAYSSYLGKVQFLIKLRKSGVFYCAIAIK